VRYSEELEIGCWQLVNLDIIEDFKMREEIEWYRQMRNYHCSKLSILRNLIDMVQHLATEEDLKDLIKSEQELNNVDRALFDAKVSRDKR